MVTILIIGIENLSLLLRSPEVLCFHLIYLFWVGLDTLVDNSEWDRPTEHLCDNVLESLVKTKIDC